MQRPVWFVMDQRSLKSTPFGNLYVETWESSFACSGIPLPLQITCHFSFSRYIPFDMYVDICIYLVHNKMNVSRIVKTTSNLKQGSSCEFWNILFTYYVLNQTYFLECRLNFIFFSLKVLFYIEPKIYYEEEISAGGMMRGGVKQGRIRKMDIWIDLNQIQTYKWWKSWVNLPN
jgi:hypothetical protein